jgi:ribosomal protein L12E/L44/L45/RPP1/RPP2
VYVNSFLRHPVLTYKVKKKKKKKKKKKRKEEEEEEEEEEPVSGLLQLCSLWCWG